MINVDELEKGITFDIFSHITKIGLYKILLIISFIFNIIYLINIWFI